MAAPFENVKSYQGISAARLEQMEQRLKDDVLLEGVALGGLVLVHEEVECQKLIPVWMAIDHIQTTKEVFQTMAAEFNVRYVRLPISPEQSPEESYIDTFILALTQQASLHDPVVINCGMGVGRTTFLMLIGLLIRNAQILATTPNNMREPNTNIPAHAALVNLAKTKSTLRLLNLLENALSKKSLKGSIAEWAMPRTAILGEIEAVMEGNWVCVTQLLGILTNGQETKRKLDRAIDKCNMLINLREVILKYRVIFYVTGDDSILSKAVGFLNRYLFLLTFCSFLDEQGVDNTLVFSSWLKGRPELVNIINQVGQTTLKLTAFRPLEDLSSLFDDFEVSKTEKSWPIDMELNPNELQAYTVKVR